MPTCAVKWCEKRSTTSNFSKDGVTFHRFPTCPEAKETWMNATRRGDEWFPTRYSTICSIHFTSDCFRFTKNNRRLLLNSARPTLFLPVLTHPSSTELEKRNAIPMLPEHSSEQTELNDPNMTPRERRMKRQIGHLTFLLMKKQKTVKRLQDQNRALIKKVTNLKAMLDVHTKKSLTASENISISNNIGVVVEKQTIKTKNIK